MTFLFCNFLLLMKKVVVLFFLKFKVLPADEKGEKYKVQSKCKESEKQIPIKISCSNSGFLSASITVVMLALLGNSTKENNTLHKSFLLLKTRNHICEVSFSEYILRMRLYSIQKLEKYFVSNDIPTILSGKVIPFLAQ